MFYLVKACLINAQGMPDKAFKHLVTCASARFWNLGTQKREHFCGKFLGIQAVCQRSNSHFSSPVASRLALYDSREQGLVMAGQQHGKLLVVDRLHEDDQTLVPICRFVLLYRKLCLV